MTRRSPEGAAPATGRLSRVSPNALQAISGSEERTEDEPPDHACITTATIASIGGRHASSAWTFKIHRTGNCRTSHFPCDGGTSFRRGPVAEVQLLAGPTQSVCGNPSVGLPEPVPPLIKNASLASIMGVRSWAAPGVSEPEATQSWSERVRCAGTRREMQVPGDPRQPSTACARPSSGSLASTKGTASAPPLPIPAR
jgi:hypothetical protein